MKKNKCILFCVSFWAAIVLFAQPLSAHDMWLQEIEGGFSIALGHEGKTDPYESARLKDVTGYTENGWTVELDIEREKEGCRVMADEAFYAVSASLDNRYWLKTIDGWENQRERKGLQIVEEGHSYKHTKHIVKWCDFLASPVGQRFEIVPLKDPTSLKQGDSLPVRVFFEGKPALKARVSKTSDMAKTHDLEPAKGESSVLVQVGPPGLQLINAKLSVPVKGKQVIWFAASLTFRTTR